MAGCCCSNLQFETSMVFLTPTTGNPCFDRTPEVPIVSSTVIIVFWCVTSLCRPAAVQPTS